MKLRWDGKGLELRLGSRHSLFFYPASWGWETERSDEFVQLVRGPFVYVKWRWPRG